MPSPAARLPAPELDDYEQFAARIHASKRTVIRLVESGLPIIEIGRLRRIDPIVGMAWVRGGLPPPESPRRGRPKKRENAATASPTAAAATPRRPKPRLSRRAESSV
jgi:hypothetical protein